MKIYPQDLGTKCHVEIVQKRAYYGSSGEKAQQVELPAVKPRMGRLGRFWAKGCDLTPAQAAMALPASGVATSGLMYGLPALWALIGAFVTTAFVAKGVVDGATAAAGFAASIAAVTGLSTLGSKECFRGLHKKLCVGEVNALPTGHDDLETAYLSLVIQAMEQPVSPDAETQIRGALRTLGEAIGCLPTVPLLEDSAEVIHGQAASVREEAEKETDSIVAESLIRQAEALERRAETVHRSAQYTRRATAIRRELRAQIETLRAGLTAYDTSAGGIMDMNGLAEAVRTVANEAESLTDAREELETFTLPASPADPLQHQVLTTTTDTAAEPTLTLRRNNG